MHCEACNEYTALGAYVEQEGRFEGEYSLLHNSRVDSDDLLCRFLLRHANHPLRLRASRTDAYSEVLYRAERFMEADIDAFVEQRAERAERRADELLLERGLGQLQLNVLRGLLEHEADDVAKRRTHTAAEAQFMLGKEEGLKRAQAMLTELMERTNALYKPSGV